MSYDPDRAPDPQTWLALPQDVRYAQVTQALEGMPGGPPSPVDLHAGLLQAVEDQIASNDPPVVRETLDRLEEAGLRRFAAVQAIMSVLMKQMASFIKEDGYDPKSYKRALTALDPADWVAEQIRADVMAERDGKGRA